LVEVGSYCIHCGAKIEPNSRFCSSCGKPTSLPAVPTPGGGTNSSEKVRKKTNKKAIVGIVVIPTVFVIVIVYASFSNASSPSSINALDDPQILVQEVGAYMQQQGWSYPQQLGDTNMTRAAEGIIKSKYFENSAMVVIIPPEKGNCWSGSAMGSDYVQTTREACNIGYFTLPCSGFSGSYSLAMQRSDESYGGEFLVQLWKGGELLKQAGTSASYGVVSFAGSCG
jgi:zinc-ribbon domain